MNQARYRSIQKANFIGAAVNFIQAVFKVVVGWLGHSPALFADGLHSFSDLSANALVWIASKISHIEPDDNHPYGHGRFETIGSLILGLFLIAIALGIAYHGLYDILHQVTYRPSFLTLLVAVLSVVANESVFHYTLRVSKDTASPLLKANAYHVRSDSLSSIIVVIGILGALAGFPFFDAIAGILVAGLILKIAFSLSWKALDELTDSSASASEMQDFTDFILSLSGVRQMHRLRTRKMAERIFLDVHILIEPYVSASEGHYIAETVRVGLMNKYSLIEDITVHVDTEDHPETLPSRLPVCRRDIAARLPPSMQNFDLYYFQTHIEIRVHVLHSALKEKSAEAWLAELEAALSPLSEIQKISLYCDLNPLSLL